MNHLTCSDIALAASGDAEASNGHWKSERRKPYRPQDFERNVRNRTHQAFNINRLPDREMPCNMDSKQLQGKKVHSDVEISVSRPAENTSVVFSKSKGSNHETYTGLFVVKDKVKHDGQSLEDCEQEVFMNTNNNTLKDKKNKAAKLKQRRKLSRKSSDQTPSDDTDSIPKVEQDPQKDMVSQRQNNASKSRPSDGSNHLRVPEIPDRLIGHGSIPTPRSSVSSKSQSGKYKGGMKVQVDVSASEPSSSAYKSDQEKQNKGPADGEKPVRSEATDKKSKEGLGGKVLPPKTQEPTAGSATTFQSVQSLKDKPSRDRKPPLDIRKLEAELSQKIDDGNAVIAKLDILTEWCFIQFAVIFVLMIGVFCPCSISRVLPCPAVCPGLLYTDYVRPAFVAASKRTAQLRPTISVPKRKSASDQESLLYCIITLPSRLLSAFKGMKLGSWISLNSYFEDEEVDKRPELPHEYLLDYETGEKGPQPPELKKLESTGAIVFYLGWDNGECKQTWGEAFKSLITGEYPPECR